MLKSPLGKLTSYRRFGNPKNFGFFSATQVRKLVNKRCELFFYSVRALSKYVELKIEDVAIVNEFMDVFLSEISSMSHKRAVEFTIDLVVLHLFLGYYIERHLLR